MNTAQHCFIGFLLACASAASVPAIAASGAAAAASSKSGESAAALGDDDRLVCKMEKKVGSNRAERTCRTVRQAREDQDAAKTRLDQYGRCAGNQSTCGGKQTN